LCSIQHDWLPYHLANSAEVLLRDVLAGVAMKCHILNQERWRQARLQLLQSPYDSDKLVQQ
jgi:hypothetical protein